MLEQGFAKPMSAFWLTFKALGQSAPQGWPMENLTALVGRFEADPTTATEWWRIAAHKAARVGDRVYVFKQGTGERGIFGVGTIIDGPEERDSPSDNEGIRPRALIKFDKLINPLEGFLLSLNDITDLIPLSLINARGSGESVPADIVPEIEKRLAPWLTPTVLPLESHQGDRGIFDPESVTDERERSLRAICIRRGQVDFRAKLLSAYAGRCAITGCAVADVLEAAHITPHLGPLTDHVSNGLLLRADIHTLFDCGLLAIHPDSRRVVIAATLNGSSYARIADARLRSTTSEATGPSKKALQRKFAEFESQQKLRERPT